MLSGFWLRLKAILLRKRFDLDLEDEVARPVFGKSIKDHGDLGWNGDEG